MENQPKGVEMFAEAEPRFKVALRHGPSGTEITTEAPKDNGGTGSSFSPTDLVAAAAAACALTTMELAASREGLPWNGASARVEKRMVQNPRRIGELVLEIRLPRGLSAEHRQRFEEIARNCPVHKSLSPETRISMSFQY